MKRLLVTIDGPAGAGKTTVSRELARRLSFKYIDTGALYRGVAFEALAAGIDPDDEAGLEKLCTGLHLRFEQNSNGLRLISNNRDITDRIRTPEMSMAASSVSAKRTVREYLLEVQRKMAEEKNAVVEGRDMGTVVFPNADMKFYLHASHGARASRRHREIAQKTGQSAEDVARDMKRRDENDSTRKLAPLMPAEDAVRIDSTRLSANEVVEIMIRKIESTAKQSKN